MIFTISVDLVVYSHYENNIYLKMHMFKYFLVVKKEQIIVLEIKTNVLISS